MKRFCLILAVPLIFFAHSTFAETPQAYLSVLPTVPIMDGAREINESAVLFDKPEGRIAQTTLYAETTDSTSLLNFYAQTLPQLGWTPSGKYTFVREQEKLVLLPLESESIEPRGTTLKVLLSPLEKK